MRARFWLRSESARKRWCRFSKLHAQMVREAYLVSTSFGSHRNRLGIGEAFGMTLSSRCDRTAPGRWQIPIMEYHVDPVKAMMLGKSCEP